MLMFFINIMPFAVWSQSRENVQNIRGVVTDAVTGNPLPFGSVILKNHSPFIGVTTDSLGRFVFTDLPVGRYDVEASYVGYSPALIREILLTSTKEICIDIALTSANTTLDEVVVRPTVDKSQSLNSMVLSSGRMLSTEEASRFAGGLDDPARLASAFAGVQTNIGDNGIVVRGNAPKMLQWKLEGVEIPNPNHFGEVGGFGGGGLTALSSQVLGNSDFLTGAFPAEYGNALSGVFDIKLRSGNNSSWEHTVSVGTMGIDLASEGPFKKNGAASYIFNYRYSTLQFMSSFLPDGAGNMRYQDLSFKLNFPTKRAGTFSLWGLGLIDSNKENAKASSDEWEYEGDRQSYQTSISTGIVGLTHRISLNDRGYWTTVLAATGSGIHSDADRIGDDMAYYPENTINKTNWNFILNSFVNFRLGGKHVSRSGITVTGMTYDILLKNYLRQSKEFLTIVDDNGASALIEAYTDFSFHLWNRWTLNTGLHGQMFLLNSHYAIEPRIAAKYQLSNKSSVSLSYGMHSRMEQLNYYLSRSEKGELQNKNLDFTRAHHLVLSFDRSLGKDYHIRMEPYLQLLYNVPVAADSSLSLINLRDEWFIQDKFYSEGKGLNYGIELTVEKFLSKGYYWLLTGYLYSSRYRGRDGVWRNTRYSRGYMVNVLFGKEWMVGRNRHNLFSANFRLTLSGGNRYSPVNEEESEKMQDVVFDESQAYSKQLSPAFWADFTVYYQMNRTQVSHEIGLKMLNATFYSEYLDHQYNFKTHKADIYRDGISMPNLYYKIEF